MDHKLNPLNRRDTAGMIAHRLAVAGRPADMPPLFSPDAVDVVHERSGGIPRAITNFCADCLVEAVFLGKEQVDGNLAAEVIARRVFPGTPSASNHYAQPLDDNRAGDETYRPLPPVQTTIPLNGGTGARRTAGEGEPR
jgi:hypothetical protein